MDNVYFFYIVSTHFKVMDAYFSHFFVIYIWCRRWILSTSQYCAYHAVIFAKKMQSEAGSLQRMIQNIGIAISTTVAQAF